jgi:cytochrome bd-type quinol oxidase subunit 2
MRKLPDNFLFGIVTALLSLGLCCFLLYGLRMVVAHYGYSNAFEEPKLQLIAVVVNVLLFRFVMVNMKKERTGRGILFITVLLTFLYLFLYSKYNFRMTPSVIPSSESEEIRV